MRERTHGPRPSARSASASFRSLIVSGLFLSLGATAFAGDDGSALPKSIRKIMDKPQYAAATWALRVVDADSGAVVYDLNSSEKLLTGSVRKLYSVGVTLNQ